MQTWMAVGVACLLTATFGCATGLDGGGDIDAGNGNSNGNGNGGGFADASASQPDGGGFGTTVDAGELPDAQAGTQRVSITHNVDAQTIATQAPDSGEPFVGCYQTSTLRHAEMTYFKLFDLAGDFGLSGSFTLESFHMGALRAESSQQSQPASLRFKHQAGTVTPDPNAQQLLALDVTIPTNVNYPAILDLDLTSIDGVGDVTVPAGRVLLIEFGLPSGIDNGNLFHIGVNFAGESRGSFVQSPASGCNMANPTPFSSIVDGDGNNLGTRHWVVELRGVHEP